MKLDQAALSRRIAKAPAFALELELMRLDSLTLALRKARAADDAAAVDRSLLELGRFARTLALSSPIEFFAEYSVASRDLSKGGKPDLDASQAFYERWFPARLHAYYQPEYEKLDRLLRARR